MLQLKVARLNTSALHYVTYRAKLWSKPLFPIGGVCGTRRVSSTLSDEDLDSFHSSESYGAVLSRSTVSNFDSYQSGYEGKCIFRHTCIITLLTAIKIYRSLSESFEQVLYQSVHFLFSGIS